MADFSPARTAHSARLADGKRREIVMVHKMLDRLNFYSFNKLGVLRPAKSNRGKNVGIAAVKHSRTVKRRQQINAGVQTSHLVRSSAVLSFFLAHGRVYDFVAHQFVHAVFKNFVSES